jgi:hypothetical protein
VDNGTTGVAATSTALGGLTTRVTTAEGSITTQAQDITALETTVNDATTGVAASSVAIGGLTTSVATINGTLTTVASDATTLATTVGAQTTAIQTNATSINGVEAQYTVKVDNNGHVSGFGLASTLVNGTPYSDFIINADRFSIGAANGDEVTPFVVTTSSTTLNGVVVPAGVYIDTAYIKNGSMTNAMIGNAAIDNAKISSLNVDKLVAGTMSTGAYIRSTNYIAGSQGFNIPATGTAEFSNVVVRGEVHATTGTFTGNLSGSTITGTTGTFSGSLNVASAASGARTVITDSAVKVYDASNNLRVKIGNLA